MEESKTNHPGLVIAWDEQSQGVNLRFDPKEFRSWDQVLNVLETATRHAKDQRAMAVMQNMQRVQNEVAIGKQLRRNIGM